MQKLCKRKSTILETFSQVGEDFNYSMLPLILLQLFFMICSSTSGTTFPVAKPGCDDHCGNVSIPFPFGTKEGCYLDSRFLVICLNNSSNNVAYPPQPVLWYGVNVTDISLEGQLRVSQFVAYGCYDKNVSSKHNIRWIGLEEPMTFNSTANKFTAIGCNTCAFVTGLRAVVKGGIKVRPVWTGCASLCDSSDVDDSCSGDGCCQTSLPNGAYEFQVSVGSFDNHSFSGSNRCSYAFVAEDKAFKFSAANLTNLDQDLTLPVVVDWVIEFEKCEEARKNSSSFACMGNSDCYDQDGALGYRCRCKEGYVGNPYLLDGCQDIDECQNPTRNNCTSHSTCVNLPGSYSCYCLPHYHGDGKGPQGCIAADQNYWTIFEGVGVSAGTAVLLGLCFCLFFEIRRRKENRRREEFFRKNGGLMLQQKLTGQRGVQTRNPRIFTLQELRQATNNFDESRIIGRGGFGTVFKGDLANNRTVAIKKSRGVDQREVEQFINEVIVLSKISNRNVVELLGCCLETEVPLLVYEFIDNGTLYEHLRDRFKALKLSWNIRLRIASEVAGVLSYLHSVASPPIIHRDIKSANVLLEQNYTAKVSDFGTSRLIPADEKQVATMVQGTQGYLDPEYMQAGQLTEKSDVYGFGVVLIELFTGKKVLSFDKPVEDRFLSNQFLSAMKEDHLVEILDDNLSCQENIDQLRKVAMIAKDCICVKGEDRPCMRNVARELEAILELSAKENSVEVFETEFKSAKILQSKEYGSCSTNDYTASSDLYPVCHTTSMQSLSSMSGGR